MSSIAFTNGFQSKIEYFSFLFSFQSIIVDKLITHYTTWILSQIVKTKEKLTCRNINYYFIIIIYYIKLLLFHFFITFRDRIVYLSTIQSNKYFVSGDI